MSEQHRFERGEHERSYAIQKKSVRAVVSKEKNYNKLEEEEGAALSVQSKILVLSWECCLCSITTLFLRYLLSLKWLL